MSEPQGRRAYEGRLTTHVLDTSLGRPAAGLTVTLYRIGEDGPPLLLKVATTNADGRCDEPLLAGASFLLGRYELVFAAGPYLAKTSAAPLGTPAFLDDVVIRFGLAEPTHYHVPLLLSAYGYSTYRGS